MTATDRGAPVETSSELTLNQTFPPVENAETPLEAAPLVIPGDPSTIPGYELTTVVPENPVVDHSVPISEVPSLDQSLELPAEVPLGTLQAEPAATMASIQHPIATETAALPRVTIETTIPKERSADVKSIRTSDQIYRIKDLPGIAAGLESLVSREK